MIIIYISLCSQYEVVAQKLQKKKEVGQRIFLATDSLVSHLEPRRPEVYVGYHYTIFQRKIEIHLKICSFLCSASLV